MIANKYRFHGYGSLRFVYKNGQVVRTHLLTIKYAKNPHREDSRFAVVVSKKVMKSAVRRNRMRRRIFEMIRQIAIPTKESFDVVVIVSSAEVLSMSPTELQQATEGIFSQIGIQKDS